jgi:two-component system, NarL family, response regulator LiaR
VTQPIRVALVNDFELIVRGLTGLLRPFHERLVVSELDVGTNPGHQADIALFDTYGHARGGVDRVHALATDPRVGAVAVYTWALAPEQLDAVLAAGARAVLAKSMPATDLADALLAVDAGQVVVSRTFRRPLVESWPGDDFGLTARESEVSAFLAAGLSNREIADALCISEHTVKSHLKSIFRKSGVSSRTQAMARIASDSGFRRTQSR